MLKYNAILFDVDGTLIDSAPGILNTLEEVFRTMGVDTTNTNLRRYLGPPLRKSFGEHFSDPAKIEEATELYRTQGSSSARRPPSRRKWSTLFWKSKALQGILTLSVVPPWMRAGTPRPQSSAMCLPSL